MKCLALFLKAAEGGGRASGRGLQMKSFLNSGIRPPCIGWFGGGPRGGRSARKRPPAGLKALGALKKEEAVR